VYLVGAVKLSKLICVALLRDTLMMDFNYVSEVILKQNEIPFLNLTFRGPCIVIYSYNKMDGMH